MEKDSKNKVYYTLKEAASSLSMATSVLLRQRSNGPLFEPALRMCNGYGGGKAFIRFHAQQIKLMLAYYAQNMSLEDAEAKWLEIKRGIGMDNTNCFQNGNN